MSKYSKTYFIQEKTEDTEQMQIINYCNSMSAYVPEYSMIYHIPNEGKRKNGAKLKRIGLRKGIPDLCLPVPKMGFNGLYIELKKDTSKKASKEQKEWLFKLEQQGYATSLCFGADEAINLITAYMTSDYETFIDNCRNGKGEKRNE